MQHVLGTLDPRIPELGPWQPVEMSNGYATQQADMIIDLSQESWAGEPAPWLMEFAASHPLSSNVRALATRLGERHPDSGASDHAAADALDNAAEDAALRHLAAAHDAIPENDPASTTSQDEIREHMRQITDLGDATETAETDHHPDVKARGDVAFANESTDDDGLTERGRKIHAKLRSKGVAHPVAVAMARRAQRKAARSHSHANEEAEALDLALSDYMAGGAASAARERQRLAEDEADNRRFRSDHDVLARALDRIGRGTYTADAGDLAVTGVCDCAGGMPTRYHELGCEAAAIDPDVVAGMVRDGVLHDYATQTAADANGNTFTDQYGNSADMTTLLQAYTGERLVNLGGPFEGSRVRERLLPTRVQRFGNPEAGDGEEITGATSELVSALAQEIGLDSAAGKRANYEARRGQAQARIDAAQALRQPRGVRTPEAAASAAYERDLINGYLPGVSAGTVNFSNDDGDGELSWAPSAIDRHGAAWR